MEFDNDRIVKRISRVELTCWILFAITAPLINSLNVFPNQPIIWIPLFLISLILLPLYILYSGMIVSKFFFAGRYATFGAITIVYFLLIHLVLFLLYKLIHSIVPETAQPYFAYTAINAIRETAWIFINSCFVIFIAFYKAKSGATETIQQINKENNFYKLRYFRTQLNPHFLFNTLNSIYSLSLNSPEKTPEVVIRLSDIMRFLMYDCNEEKILLTREIEFIRNYIEIEKIRYDADIRFTVEGRVDGVMIEPFMFITFIENGFKHAIDNSFARPFVYITLKVTEGQVILNVINNTNIEFEKQAKKISGKSLQNSKSILELLYPDSYALDIIQTEKKQRKESKLRLKNAQERLQEAYPDAHTLDVILSNNTFTVSLILKTASLDTMYNSGR